MNLAYSESGGICQVGFYLQVNSRHHRKKGFGEESTLGSKVFWLMIAVCQSPKRVEWASKWHFFAILGKTVSLLSSTLDICVYPSAAMWHLWGSHPGGMVPVHQHPFCSPPLKKRSWCSRYRRPLIRGKGHGCHQRYNISSPLTTGYPWKLLSISIFMESDALFGPLRSLWTPCSISQTI